jgi:hypothetical protein
MFSVFALFVSSWKRLDEYARLPFARKQVCLMLAETLEGSTARSSMCFHRLLWLCEEPVVGWLLKQANMGHSLVLLSLLTELPSVSLGMFSDLDTQKDILARKTGVLNIWIHMLRRAFELTAMMTFGAVMMHNQDFCELVI